MGVADPNYLANIEEQEKKKTTTEESQPKQTNTGDSGSITASTTPITPATPDQAKRGSGQFTNLKNYIQANRNFNAAGGGLAGKVAGNIETQGRDVETQIGGAKEAFTQQKTQALEPIRQGAQLTQQAVANPMQFAQNQQNVQAVQAARDAEYKGPKSLADLQGRQSQAALQGQTQDFTTKVQQGQTEQGRFNLLRNMFARPTYSTGQQNLDNLLIQGQRDQIQRIADTGRTAAKVNQQLRQNIDQASQLGQQATQEARNIQQQTRGALNQRVLEERDAINTALEQAQRQQDRELYRLASGLQSGNIDKDIAEKYGIAPGQRMFNTNLTDLLNAGAIRRGMDPTAETVAREENYDQLAALRNILGQAAEGESLQALQQFTDRTKAGNFSTDPVFDRNILQSRIDAGQAKYNEGIKSLVDDYVDRQIAMAEAQGIDVNLGAYNRMRETLLQQISGIAPEDISKERLRQDVFAAGRPAELMAERIKQLQQQTGVLNRLNVNATPTAEADYEKINNFLKNLGLARRTENV